MLWRALCHAVVCVCCVHCYIVLVVSHAACCALCFAAAKGGPRAFDINKYARRSVVLQLMYVGWNYHGFARQTDTENTIEGVLFPTLKHVKLITEDHYEDTSLGYSRCGRTDKGVSAMGQVRSCMVGGRVLAAVGVGLGAEWCCPALCVTHAFWQVMVHFCAPGASGSLVSCTALPHQTLLLCLQL